MTTTDLVKPDLSQLAIPGVELTYTSLVVTDPDLDFADFTRIVHAGTKVHSAAKFWIGDAIAFGETVFGESYAQAFASLNFSEQYLSNIASICRKVHRSRRREELSFSHHSEVARLEPKEQVEWLEAAVANEWSTEELRIRLREAVPTRRSQQPQWGGQTSLEAPGPLTLAKVEEAEQHASKVETQSLPATHPIWETQARSLARDVKVLAQAVKPPLLEAAELVAAAAECDPQEGYWRVPDEEFRRLIEALKTTKEEA